MRGTVFYVALVTLVIGALVGAVLWPYTINAWLVFFHKPPTVVWWQGAIIGFLPIIGHATVPVAFVTWVLMMFLS